MTIKFLAPIAIAATLFTACSESTVTPPTKAEQCAAGLSADCLTGTWSIDGPTAAITYDGAIIYTIDQSHNLKDAPATVKFYTDEKKGNQFEYTLSNLTKAQCDVGKTYGTWEIVNGALHLTATTNTICMPDNDLTITPIFKNEDGEVTMTFNQLFFMKPEYGGNADVAELLNKTEVYKFVSSN